MQSAAGAGTATRIFGVGPGDFAGDAILNAVWGNWGMVTERSIDRCVTTLRAKIEADPHRPVWIQTIRDVGYRFEVVGD